MYRVPDASVAIPLGWIRTAEVAVRPSPVHVVPAYGCIVYVGGKADCAASSNGVRRKMDLTTV
jgi:hypothetical protein